MTPQIRGIEIRKGGPKALQSLRLRTRSGSLISKPHKRQHRTYRCFLQKRCKNQHLDGAGDILFTHHPPKLTNSGRVKQRWMISFPVIFSRVFHFWLTPESSKKHLCFGDLFKLPNKALRVRTSQHKKWKSHHSILCVERDSTDISNRAFRRLVVTRENWCDIIISLAVRLSCARETSLLLPGFTYKSNGEATFCSVCKFHVRVRLQLGAGSIGDRGNLAELKQALYCFGDVLRRFKSMFLWETLEAKTYKHQLWANVL